MKITVAGTGYVRLSSAMLLTQHIKEVAPVINAEANCTCKISLPTPYAIVTSKWTIPVNHEDEPRFRRSLIQGVMRFKKASYAFGLFGLVTNC